MLQEAAEQSKAEADYRRKARPGANKKPAKKMAFEEDDLDDLDDLMGDSNKKDAIDEDDFFGGGNDEEDDYVPKKKKGKAVDNDPLAFLKAAQEEKQGNALKKAMAEQEASAAWKQIEELNYNLINKFMDNEDKWR